MGNQLKIRIWDNLENKYLEGCGASEGGSIINVLRFDGYLNTLTIDSNGILKRDSLSVVGERYEVYHSLPIKDNNGTELFTDDFVVVMRNGEPEMAFIAFVETVNAYMAICQNEPIPLIDFEICSNSHRGIGFEGGADIMRKWYEKSQIVIPDLHGAIATEAK